MKVTVIAMPSSAKDATIVAGSGKANCVDCAAVVHVAPSTANLMCANPAATWEFRCIDCAAKQIQSMDPKDVSFALPTPEQFAEIQEAQR